MITITTLNTYHGNYAQKTESFLLKTRPNILFLQELSRLQFRHYCQQLNMHGLFAPMTDILDDNSSQLGIAILATEPLNLIDTVYYGEFRGPKYYTEYGGEKNIPHTVLLTATTTFHEQDYTLGCTHFAWSENGESTPEHMRAAERLLKSLSNYDDIVLAGDFNAPRGRETFQMLAQRYTDNVPDHVRTTLDTQLHRAAPLVYVVDTIFTSPHYKVSNVNVVDGVSDHCAVSGTLERIG